MNEQAPTPEEELPSEQEMEEMIAAHLKDHPEPVIPEEGPRSCEAEAAEAEAMIAAFETEHSLESLHSVTFLLQKDAENHAEREAARKALNPINAKLQALKKETDISEEAWGMLRAKYQRLSRAVGIIMTRAGDEGKVDHER